MSRPPLSARFQIVKQCCQENGYLFEELDSYGRMLMKVTSNGQELVLLDGHYPLNGEAEVAVAKDKVFASMLLQKRGIRFPEGDYFFITPEYREYRSDGRELGDALVFAKQFGYPLFAKPIDGAQGMYARIVQNEVELKNLFKEAVAEHYGMLLQKPLEGQEHRLFLVDGEAFFTYRKARPSVIADGQKSLSDLIDAYLGNQTGINQAAREHFIAHLSTIKIDLQTVFAEGKRIFLAPNANPNNGGFIDDVREEVPEPVKEWGRKIAETIKLRVCAVDFFAHESVDENPADFVVLEVNGNPSLKTIWALGHKELAKRIWHSILSKIFAAKEGQDFRV